MQELRAYVNYFQKDETLSYWHTYNNKEIDVVVGQAKIGIEIKSTTEIQPKHLSNFKDYHDEFPNSRCIIVSRDKLTRRNGNIEIMYVFDFLKQLWAGEIF